MENRTCGNCIHYNACDLIMRRYTQFSGGLVKYGSGCSNYARRTEDVVEKDYTPVLRCRTEKYERYEECGVNENGETIYLKRVFVDEKSYAMYCPKCGKRLCSRFTNFCPNCGVRMKG